jgi:hypothetical protein
MGAGLMAMNKAEKAMVQGLRVLASLRWTQPVLRDVKPPVPIDDFGSMTTGWDFNAHTLEVDRWWSTTTSHGRGVKAESRYSGMRESQALFSTKVLALRAMRYEVEQMAARRLASIDARIEEAIEEEKGLSS